MTGCCRKQEGTSGEMIWCNEVVGVPAVRKYIIYAPLYEENTGGVIVLHKLCALLNEMGCDATIWPLQKPHPHEILSLRGMVKVARWCLLVLPKFLFTSLDFRGPYGLKFAGKSDIADAIVVYPEMVNGNPLNATHVVRWFLNKPGVLTGKIEYGSNELYFYYQVHFNDTAINFEDNNHLNVVEFMDDVYRDEGLGERSGSCYMVRKGLGRSLDKHEAGSKKIDGLSHSEIAEIFNRCKYFVSYDLYTMYSRYAAMCGCIPIVVPDEDVTKEQWRPVEENRLGIAYGWDDIQWAIDTRDDLIKVMHETSEQSKKSVISFIEVSQRFFSA